MSLEQQKTAITADLLKLPVFKNYSDSEIVTTFNSVTKGEKKIFNIGKLVLLSGLIFCVAKWILPAVFLALGKLAAIVAVIVGIISFFIFLPLIIKILKGWAKAADRRWVTNNPFLVMDEARVKIVEAITSARTGKGKMTKFRDDAQSASETYEAQAKSNEQKIGRIRTEVNAMKVKLEEMLAKNGPDYAGEDPYIDLKNEFDRKLAESNRISNELIQAQDFTVRYGARASTIKKVLGKVAQGENALVIKLADFDSTYDWLKKQYEFAKEAKFVSSQLKDAFSFEKEWQFELASNVIANTIAADMANASGNFNDIDALTSQYALNSDELYDKLNILADDINTGKLVTPTAKRYENPDVKLTGVEKRKSGFGELDF